MLCLLATRAQELARSSRSKARRGDTLLPGLCRPLQYVPASLSSFSIRPRLCLAPASLVLSLAPPANLPPGEPGVEQKQYWGRQVSGITLCRTVQ